MMEKIILFAIVGLLLAQGAWALAVTPGRTTINFEPGMEGIIDFEIVNSEHKDMNLIVSVEGDLAEAVSISEKNIFIGANENSKLIKYNIKLPSSLEPGLHKTNVIVSESPKNSEGLVFLGATVGAATQFFVQVPYPGKYLETSLVVSPSEQKENTIFTIPIVSRGMSNLQSVKANVDIYDENNALVDSIVSNELSLESGGASKFTLEWIADVPIGNYVAVASVIYDGEVASAEESFEVNGELLEFKNIKVENFKLGDIVDLKVGVENKLNDSIIGVYSFITVYDDFGNIVDEIKSTSTDLQGGEDKFLDSKWDTAELEKGSYDIVVSIVYGGKVIEMDKVMRVYGRSVSFDGEKERDFILIAVVVVLALLILVWFFFLRRKKRR